MQPETTDKITADTNIEVDRIILRKSYDMPVDPYDPTVYLSATNAFGALLTSSFFAVTPYFGYLDAGGNRLYKGTWYMPLLPYSQSAFSNYADATTPSLFGCVYEGTTQPSVGMDLFILVKSVNVKL